MFRFALLLPLIAALVGEDHHQADLPPGVVAIPASVRRDLGMSFAKASYRPVAATIMVPGTFSVPPEQDLRVKAPCSGRLHLLVKSLDSVAAGQALATIDAPAWRRLQAELAASEAQVHAMRALLVQAEARRDAARIIATEPGPIFAADLRAAEAAVDAALSTQVRLLGEAAHLHGLSIEDLTRSEADRPYWQSLEQITLRAERAGTVREILQAEATWIGDSDDLLMIRGGSSLRFQGRALQADVIDALRDGQTVHLIPPDAGGRRSEAMTATGILRIGSHGDADSRTLDVYVDVAEPLAWMRPDVAAYADVVVAGSRDDEELAIPLRCVIQDGLERVYFRRDPKNPDRVMRMVADVGVDDGRYIVVHSGLGEHDEVVLDGVFQLKLATTGQPVKAGHFHADGTWHEGDH